MWACIYTHTHSHLCTPETTIEVLGTLGEGVKSYCDVTTEKAEIDENQ